MYVVGCDDRYADRNAGCPAADIDCNANTDSHAGYTNTAGTVRTAPLSRPYTDCVSIEFTRSPPLPRCEPTHHAGATLDQRGHPERRAGMAKKEIA